MIPVWLACIAVVFIAIIYTPRMAQVPIGNENTEYKLIEVDSCEYILYHSIYNPSEDKITHKGNCIYCQKRLEKTLKKSFNETRK